MPFWVQFHEFKLLLVEGADLAKDALHIHIGLAIFIVARLLWRRRGGWIFAWLVALAATLGGEYMDIIRERAQQADVPAEAHWHDIWNTMLWPTVLLFVGRWLEPRPKPVRDEKAEAESGDLADESLEHPPAV